MLTNKAINNPNATELFLRNHFAWKKEVPFSSINSYYRSPLLAQEFIIHAARRT
jgi:hypothetical protein